MEPFVTTSEARSYRQAGKAVHPPRVGGVPPHMRFRPKDSVDGAIDGLLFQNIFLQHCRAQMKNAISYLISNRLEYRPQIRWPGALELEAYLGEVLSKYVGQKLDFQVRNMVTDDVRTAVAKFVNSMRPGSIDLAGADRSLAEVLDKVGDMLGVQVA